MEHLLQKSKCSIFYNIFKYVYVIFQMCQNELMWSKGLSLYLQVSSADKIFIILHLKILYILTCASLPTELIGIRIH